VVITGGAKANSLGQLAQQFVRKYLEDQLSAEDIGYISNGHIPGIRHTGDEDDRETTFDLVLVKDGKYVRVGHNG